MNDVLDLIDKMGEAEDAITEMEFISPVFNSTEVATSVKGLVHRFLIPKRVPGWYRIRPRDLKRAKVLGEADMEQIEGYLKRLPKIRLVLAMRQDNVYYALPQKNNAYGLSLSLLQPVLLFDDSVMDFDQVVCRFDGANFWFEGSDFSNDPAKGEYLRASFEKFLDPKKIKFSGLTLEEKAAYALREKLDKTAKEERKKRMVREDVEHAGGKFIKFLERKDHFSVTYTVDGQQYTSHVSKDPSRRVIAAGLCLAGNDRLFDLKSLITVVREAQHEDVVHRFEVR